MKKRVFSVMLIIAMLMGFMPIMASAEEYPVLTFGETVTVELGAGESKWYQFTPETDGRYSFDSSDEEGVDPVAALYDSSMTKIAENDDDNGANFRINAQLVAGETYYIEAYEFERDNTGSYSLTVSRALPTDVFFDEYSMESFVGESYTLKAHIYPEDADNTLTWKSSDESIATVDENGKVTFLKDGEVMITAETLNGLTDNCYFTVFPVFGTMEFGTEYEVVYQDEESPYGLYYKFTPTETAHYAIYSYDIVSDTEDIAVDPRAWMFDAYHDEVGYNDDDGEDVNFRLEALLEAGKTYYLKIYLYDKEARGSIKVNTEKIPLPESVSIDCGDITLEEGGLRDIYVTYSPLNAFQVDYTVESSDETVVGIDDKAAVAVGGGEATVTVTTENGLTDSIKVTVLGVAKLELDKEYTLECIESEGGNYMRYSYTPTVPGIYTIKTTGSTGEGFTTAVAIKDASGELRRNQEEKNSFILSYALEAGKKYYYEVNLTGDAGSINFMLTKKDDSTILKAETNTTYDVNIANGGGGAYYVFRPKYTGMYKIFSGIKDEIIDTKLYVYNSEWELFYSNDDGADNGQFYLEKEFTAGETYYLYCFPFDNNVIGEFTMRIEPDRTLDAKISQDGNSINITSNLNDADAMLYVAFYEGNKMIGIKEASLSEGRVTVPEDAKNFTKCAIYAFKSSAKPIYDPVVLTKE